MLAVTAFALATSTQRFAAHLDRAGVEALFEPEGYSELMRFAGWWPTPSAR